MVIAPTNKCSFTSAPGPVSRVPLVWSNSPAMSGKIGAQIGRETLFLGLNSSAVGREANGFGET